MKKIFIAGCLLLASLAQAQISFETYQGINSTPLLPNQVFTYSTVDEATAKLNFRAINAGSEPVYLKLRMTDMDAPGTNVQFCFGVCLYSVQEGYVVPSNGAVEVPEFTEENGPGKTPNGDHFWNNNPGDGVTPMHFTLTFVQAADDEGNGPLTDLISFQYVYNPNLSVGDIETTKNMGIRIASTLIDNTVSVESDEPAYMEIFSLNGQLLKRNAIDGSLSVDVSDLASGTYLLHFSKNGQQSNVRIIKR